ncbi:MAG: hypothetical protein R3C44_05325 [Chloroflexota bacterium]
MPEKPSNLTVRQRPSPTIQPEQAFARTTAVTAVAGLDEAGRGALAGPVYAAAVILLLDDVTITQTLISKCPSSSMLTPGNFVPPHQPTRRHVRDRL